MVTQKSAKRRGARAEQIIGERFLSGRRAYREGIPGSTDLLNPYHLHVDVKSHASLSAKWYEWMDAAESVGANIAAVTCQKIDRLFFIFRASTVDALYTGEARPVVHVIENARPPKTPIGWLDNMIDHVEVGMTPCIALHQKGSPYEKTVIVMEFRHFDHWTEGKRNMSDNINKDLIDDLRARIAGMADSAGFPIDRLETSKVGERTIDAAVQSYYEAQDRVDAAKLEMQKRRAVFDEETATLRETIERWTASANAAKAEADFLAIVRGETIDGLQVEDHTEADILDLDAFLRWAVKHEKYGLLKVDNVAATRYVRETDKASYLQDAAWLACPAQPKPIKKTKWTAKLRKAVGL